MRAEPVQRLRVTYGVDGPLRYASVLDMGRLWERLLRRARVRVAYSAGYSPHPRLQFASALPVGYSSGCERVDILVAQPVEPSTLSSSLQEQAPPGLTISGVDEVPLRAPSLQATMHTAQYRVWLRATVGRDEVERAIDHLLAQNTVLQQREKKGRSVEYDLRPLIEELCYEACPGNHDHPSSWHALRMSLKAGSSGTGRPERVLEALDLPIEQFSIHCLRLLWGDSEESKP